MSQDIIEIKCSLVLGGKAFGHQIEDSKVLLLRRQVN